MTMTCAGLSSTMSYPNVLPGKARLFMPASFGFLASLGCLVPGVSGESKPWTPDDISEFRSFMALISIVWRPVLQLYNGD